MGQLLLLLLLLLLLPVAFSDKEQFSFLCSDAEENCILFPTWNGIKKKIDVQLFLATSFRI